MTSVTSVVKVKDRKHIYQYDLCDDKLVIEYRYGKKEPIRINLTAFALKELRGLLEPRTLAAVAIMESPPVDRPPGSVPKGGIEGETTAEGMLRTPDGIESGMEE